jgi:hypothetical protein
LKICTFNQKQILPPLQLRLNPKNPESNQPRKRPRNLTRRIKNTQPPRKFIPLIKRRQIKDNPRVKPTLRHPQKPSRSNNAPEIRRGGRDHGHAAEYHHGDWEDELGAETLGEHVHGEGREDEWDVEDAEEEVVLGAGEVEVGG